MTCTVVQRSNQFYYGKRSLKEFGVGIVHVSNLCNYHCSAVFRGTAEPLCHKNILSPISSSHVQQSPSRCIRCESHIDYHPGHQTPTMDGRSSSTVLRISRSSELPQRSRQVLGCSNDEIFALFKVIGIVQLKCSVPIPSLEHFGAHSWVCERFLEDMGIWLCFESQEPHANHRYMNPRFRSTTRLVEIERALDTRRCTPVKIRRRELGPLT